MAAPWQETPSKVVIEWKKASGVSRRVVLSHTRDAMPSQLVNRIDPKAYDALLADCERLSLEHPYVAKANAEYCCSNLLGMFSFLAIGLGCFKGDAGDYATWLAKVQQMVDVHAPYFQQCGCQLSVKQVHGSYWVQIDITGPAAPQYAGYAPQQAGYQQQPGGYPQQQGGYPPQQGGYPGGYPQPYGKPV